MEIAAVGHRADQSHQPWSEHSHRLVVGGHEIGQIGTLLRRGPDLSGPHVENCWTGLSSDDRNGSRQNDGLGLKL